MFSQAKLVASFLILLATSISGATADVYSNVTRYQPCPLLNAYFPPPTLSQSAAEVQALSAKFTSIFDDLVQTGRSADYGAVTPNTTSFSVVMFTGSAATATDSIIFEYHYTAPLAHAAQNVTANTIFASGTLTQLFTVYTWLAQLGDRDWNAPVTEFVPELSATKPNGIPWQDITIGDLAGHMSGLPRDVDACTVCAPCTRQKFLQAMTSSNLLFLSNTTPILSNAAFQLLSIALAHRSNGTSGEGIKALMLRSVLQPLGMSRSTMMSCNTSDFVFGGGITTSALGNPASHGLLTTTADLATAGHSILTSRLVPPSVTRRWLKPVSATSNLRNSVGRPWEIFHSGKYANSTITDVYLKSGSIGDYSSYFGLNTDFNVGFAILAHDADGLGAPDLNVHADIVSEALGHLSSTAVSQMLQQFGGSYGQNQNTAKLIFGTGPGLAVETLILNGTNIRAEVAKTARIQVANLDFKLYPTSVTTNTTHQYIVVIQDKAAPVDADTPTCITWMDVGALQGVVTRAVFHLDVQGLAQSLEFPDLGQILNKS